MNESYQDIRLLLNIYSKMKQKQFNENVVFSQSKIRTQILIKNIEKAMHLYEDVCLSGTNKSSQLHWLILHHKYFGGKTKNNHELAEIFHCSARTVDRYLVRSYNSLKHILFGVQAECKYELGEHCHE